jgi:hypothetical protein
MIPAIIDTILLSLKYIGGSVVILLRGVVIQGFVII